MFRTYLWYGSRGRNSLHGQIFLALSPSYHCALASVCTLFKMLSHVENWDVTSQDLNFVCRFLGLDSGNMIWNW